MFKDIRNQMNILGSLGFSIPVFSLKDFYICDKSFVFFNMQNILPIEEHETLTIKHPFVDRSFFSPEMSEIKKLPSTINTKSWMFSAASMISTLLNLKHGKKHLKKLINVFRRIESIVEIELESLKS